MRQSSQLSHREGLNRQHKRGDCPSVWSRVKAQPPPERDGERVRVVEPEPGAVAFGGHKGLSQILKHDIGPAGAPIQDSDAHLRRVALYLHLHWRDSVPCSFHGFGGIVEQVQESLGQGQRR